MNTMSPQFIENAMEDLAQLENYLEGRLADVRARRGKHVESPTGQQEIATDGVNLRIDPRKKEITLTW
jgi:hypothetical protein